MNFIPLCNIVWLKHKYMQYVPFKLLFIRNQSESLLYSHVTVKNLFTTSCAINHFCPTSNWHLLVLSVNSFYYWHWRPFILSCYWLIIAWLEKYCWKLEKISRRNWLEVILHCVFFPIDSIRVTAPKRIFSFFMNIKSCVSTYNFSKAFHAVDADDSFLTQQGFFFLNELNENRSSLMIFQSWY